MTVGDAWDRMRPRVVAALAGDDLLPCPFCGGRAVRDSVQRGPGYDHCPDDPDARGYFVRCISCAAQGPWWKSERPAVRAWNMRHTVATDEEG